MNPSIQSLQINDLNDLIGMDKYIIHMNKWYSNLNKIFILSLEGNTGIGKSLLGTLFLEKKIIIFYILIFQVLNLKI